MTQNEYGTISAVIASRRKTGEDYGTIRADLESARAVPFTDEEWAKLRFLAALDVAFSSVPKPAPSNSPNDTNDSNTVIRVRADSSGKYSVEVKK